MKNITNSPLADLFMPHCGSLLRFVAFRRLLLTVSTCVRQVCKRHPSMMQKVVFHEAKSRVSQAGRTPLKNVTFALQHKIIPLMSANFYKPIILTCLALMTTIAGWGQGVTGNKYIGEIETLHYPLILGYEDYRSTSSNNHAENAFDGKTDTYWQMNQLNDDSNSAWVVLDLGDDVADKVESITFTIPTNSSGQRQPKQIYVYTSSTLLDGATTEWGDAIFSQENIQEALSDGTFAFTKSSEIINRYIKIEVKGTTDDDADGGYNSRISEIEFNLSSGSEFPTALIECSNIPVKHKEAKWYTLANGYNLLGTFDVSGEEEPKMIDASENGVNVQLQNTHTLVETIYVVKGSTTRLRLPDWLNGTANNRSYQRWYNYNTGGTFATGSTGDGDVQDLLTPPEIRRNNNHAGNVPDNGTGYRFANGYIGSPLSENPLYAMDFYFPADETENEFVVACDVSGYTDYTSSFSRNTSSSFLNVDERGQLVGDVYEPTLGHRFIYHIIAVDADTKTQKEEMDITMPATRIPNMTEEMVALQRDARSYVADGNPVTVDNPLKVTLENNTAGITLCNDEGGNKFYLEDADGDYWFDGNNYLPIPSEGDDGYSDFENDGNDYPHYSLYTMGPGDYLPLIGESRVIHFTYPKTNPDNTMSVNSVTTGQPGATIVVKNGDTEVARFNLTFVEADRLLSQSQVAELDAMTDDDVAAATGWETLSYRTPNELNATYQRPLVELNFDYGTSVMDRLQYSRDGYYTFPLAWSSSSYGFFDGGPDYTGNNNDRPEWGYYAIMSNYLECGTWSSTTVFNKPDDATRLNSSGTQSDYHLFADVSDRPGIIARLPFTENLCIGTELFVTAWVKSARGGIDRNNAAVLFTIMGVTNEDDGTKTYTPIYRYQTGQIPTTYYNDGNVNLPGFNASGTNNATSANTNNEWMQAYFSFINQTDRDFDSYALQIDNNSSSTNGGDIYIDDIRVYIAPVNPDVTQLTTSCANGGDDDSERTRFNVDFDYERLLSRVGSSAISDEDAATASQKSRVALCLIDRDIYDAEIAEAVGEEDGEPTSTQIQEALEAAKASIYITEEGGTAMDNIMLDFSNRFSENTMYDNSLPVQDADGNYNFYGRTTDTGNSLTTDFYADVEPNHTYYILVANPDAVTSGDGDGGDGSTGTPATGWEMFDGFNDVCAIKGQFTVTPRNMLRINGEIVDPTLTRCENETYNFTAELRVPTGETNEDGQKVYEPLDPSVADVYFDWYFGTESSYITDATYGMTLQTALALFRETYPEAGEVTGLMIDDAAGNTELENALRVVRYYAEEAVGAANGQHPHPLVLHSKSINITMLAGGLNLIAQPIKTEVKDESGNPVSVCWDYIPLTLAVDDAAPTVKPGFNWIYYPGMNADDEEDYQNLDPSLRIGLAQLRSVSNDATYNAADNSLRINLRDAQYSGAAGATGLAQTLDEDKHIYLVSTDDPAYAQFFRDGAAFDQYSLPAGEIKSFAAVLYQQGKTAEDDNMMTLQFDLTTETPTELTDEDGNKLTFKFEPKEGYTYNFAVHFEEVGSDGNALEGPCPGHFILPVKVVPEYVKWEGSADGEGNWNNDDNWKRVSSTDLKMATAPEGGDENLYDGTVYNNTEGFVPMLFTKVIMPSGSKVKLYRAGYYNNSWVLGNPKDQTGSPDVPTQKPTLNIQYDLMAFGNEPGKETMGNITTELYRVNLCDEIHFEPGAEMLRPEYLLYNKAWIDMDVPAGEWTLVSSPLQGVVSGDWYTKQSGVQDTEYFTDITFTADYNRLKPFVTQRTWGTGASVVENASGSSTDNNVPVSFTTTWSSLFNDTSVPYTSGNGYSVRTAGINASDKTQTFETLTFRFPKADTSYDYSSGTISRTNPGRLVTDGILKRVNDVKEPEEGGPITINDAIENEYIKIDSNVEGITLTNIAERTDGQGTIRYAIVGNPFMANLDVSKFIEVNSNVLEPKYWIDSNVSGNAAGTATQNGDAWTWTESTDGLVGQYKAFCVQLKPSADPVVKFTHDMAELTMTADEATTTANFTITAKNDERTSSAALAYDAQADNGYVSVEDAELMTDILGNGNRLAVYTVADNTAVSVNKIKDLHLIPVGLFANDDDVTTVTFTGVAALLEPTLYDAETNTETALTEGYTLTIDGESHGRYFIRTRGAGEGTTDIEETVTDDVNNVNVYSVENGKVVVASDTELLDVMIYSVGGAVLKHETVSSGRTAITLDNVDSGVVIVKVTTADCTITRKIIVR